MADARKLMPFVLRWEGGYVDDPRDAGGATNKGVTLKTYTDYRKEKYPGQPAPTKDDLKRITDDEWLEIFKLRYWDRWRADEIADQSVADMVVDWTWCSGVHGIKNPQKTLGVAADGIVGRNTIGAVNRHPSPRELFGLIKRSRLDFIDRICASNPKNRAFRKGWLNRINALDYGS